MTIRKFAVVVDGEVAGTMVLDDASGNEIALRHIAAFESDPKIIPMEEDSLAAFGWTYDGTTFLPPIE